MRVDIERQRLRHADRIGQLDRATRRQSCRHDVLGEVAGDVGSRTVDLGRVLAAESAAAVRCRAAIGIDDDLAARETGIAVGPADLERTGGIDVPFGRIGQPAGGQDVGHDLLHIGLELGFLFALVVALAVLGRDDHRGAFHRLAVFIAQRDLALRIGFEEGCGTALAVGSQPFENLVAVVERSRHVIGRFIAGEAKHDALVARALVLVAASIDALRDVIRLAMQMVLELERLPVETFLLVADFAHGAANRLFDFVLCARSPAAIVGPIRIVLVVHRRAADLAGQDDALRRRHGFAGDARFRIFCQHQVDDGIADLVGNLVRMAFGNAFRREQVIGAH